MSRTISGKAPRPTSGPPPTNDEVIEVLGSVVDPELGADIVSLGMVPSVVVADDGLVTIEIKLTISGCPMRAEIKKEVEDRVELHPGRLEGQDHLGRNELQGAQPGDDQGSLERSRERR